MAEVLFEYKGTPAFGFFGKYGGYSVTIYDDGDVVRREYIFAKENPSVEEKIAYVPEIVKELEAVLNQYKENLKLIPDELNNGTLDGSHDCFQFGTKRISAWTINRTDLEEIRKMNPYYYESYKENMLAENFVLDIYNEIVNVIKKYGFDFGLKIR